MNKKIFGSDFNLDGKITISDYSLWLESVYDNTVVKLSNNIVVSIQNTDFGRFFEISPDGLLASMVYLYFWFVFWSIVLVTTALFIFLLIKAIKVIKVFKDNPEKLLSFKSENRVFQTGFYSLFFFILFLIASSLGLNNLSVLFLYISFFSSVWWISMSRK